MDDNLWLNFHVRNSTETSWDLFFKLIKIRFGSPSKKAPTSYSVNRATEFSTSERHAGAGSFPSHGTALIVTLATTTVLTALAVDYLWLGVISTTWPLLIVAAFLIAWQWKTWQTGRSLTAREQYFRALVDNSASAVVLLSIDSIPFYQSLSTRKISGYDLAEVQVLPAHELVHPSDRPMVQEQLQQLLTRPRSTVSTVHRIRHRDGHYIWVEGTFTNLLSDSIIGALVFSYHDVTEKIQAEQEKLRHRDRFQNEKQLSDSIINSLPGVFYLYDKNGKFIRWNKNFERASGYTSEEVASMHPLDFLDNKELALERIQSVFKNGMDELECGFVKKTGEVVPYYFNGALVSLEGEECLIGMGIDITERVKAQEAILNAYHEKDTTLNRINDAVVSLDTSWRYTFLNDAALASHPLGREGTIGKHLLEVHPEMADTTFWTMYQESMASGEVMETEDYYLPLDVWFSAKAYPSADGLTIFYKDITNRKKTEKELMNLVATLEAKNKDLQQFSYIVSHNLRAPVAKIAGLTTIIGVNPQEDKQLIDLIAEEAHQLDEVVKDISSIVYARKTDGLQVQKTSIRECFEQALHSLQGEISVAQVSITTDFSQIDEVETVRPYLASILYNLVSNAVKYRRSNVVATVHIKTSIADPYVCISVTDNGMGIDLKRNQNKIFGLYKRFHGQDIPGRGLGLNLVKTQAEALGGKVEVDSALNRGTTFKVFLPIQHGKADQKSSHLAGR